MNNKNESFTTPKRKLLVGVSGAVGSSNVENYLYYLSHFFEIKVILTESSENFCSPLLLSQYASGIYSDMYVNGEVPHVQLPMWADVFVIIPATANTIGKIANGIADNLLTSCVINFNQPIVICPNMNMNMWNNKAVRRNVNIMRDEGFIFLNTVRSSYEVATKKTELADASLPTINTLIHTLMNQVKRYAMHNNENVSD